MHPISELLTGHKAGRILDVGTRYGDFIRLVIEHAEGVEQAIGIDIGIPSLVDARGKSTGSGIGYLAATVDMLPFEAGHFDTVVMANALHHLPDPVRGLGEMLRVLKPGGMLMIAEYICDTPTEAQGSFISMHDLGGDIARFAGITHRRFYERAEVLAVIEGLGLEGIRTRGTEPPPAIHDPAKIESQADNFFTHLTEIAGTPEHDRYSRAMVTARMRAVRTGIQRPSQVYVAGRKRSDE